MPNRIATSAGTSRSHSSPSKRVAASLAAFALPLAALGGVGVTVAQAAPTPTGPELVSNGSLEAGTPLPTCFARSGWGTEGTWESVAGRNSAKAVAVTIAGYQAGDRKLLQAESTECAPKVQAGKSYRLSVWYRSTAPTNLTVFRHSPAGWSYWGELKTAPASTDWAELRADTPAMPADTDAITFGLSLAQDGTLVTDDYSARELATPPVDPAGELVANGNLSDPGPGGVPECFAVTGWGQRNVAGRLIDDVPADLPQGSKAYRLTVSNHVTGDAKLLTSEEAGCAPAVQADRRYRLSVRYRADVQTTVSIFRHTANGWEFWTDAKTLPTSAAWTTGELVTPEIPQGTDRIAFGLTIAGNGTVDTTGYSALRMADETDAPTGDPKLVGKWDVLTTRLPVRAIHSTLLNDGRLLLIAGSGNDGAQFAAGTFKAVVWNPKTMAFKDIKVPMDMFCSGHVTLADGKVLLAGGTEAYPEDNEGPNTFKGSKKSYYFDPKDDSFHAVNDMADAHWYPSLTKLGNGNVWSAGGLDAKAEGTVATEMFNAATMKWLPLNQVPQTWSYWGTYPHMFLLESGTMFYTGAHTFGNGLPGTGASLYDWQKATIKDVPGLRDKDMRDQAGSVFVGPVQDQKIMIVGGGNTDGNVPAVNTVDMIDLKAAAPQYVPGPALPGPGKAYVNLVNLPDRTVLSSNGARLNRTENVKTAAIFDPVKVAWNSIDPDPIGRNYHSSAILLPDGRVAVLGSNPGDNSFEMRISVYSPPYLFKAGTRPSVTSSPAQAAPGASIKLGVTGDVVSASLVSPLSSTHQTDTNARLIDLPISGSGTTRTAQIPKNTNIVPPGPYMLTVLDSQGVPSVAKWVWVR